ncbi:MAG TPA: peptidase [Sphaerochaeta sp.]|nr:peptidase [Sphaerochaeta sp.]
MALTVQMEKYLIDSHQDAKDIVRELCKIPAPSHHEENRARWCEEWFKSAGGQKVYVDEALNAVCEYNVTEDNDLVVFMAHIDTVFPDTEPMPFIEKDGLFYSPGVTDDTGNLASLLIAERYILKNSVPTTCGMVFVANSCEEGLGNLKGSRAIVSRYGKRIKEFITVDGTNLSRIVNGAVGSHRYRITVKTEGGHSYGAFGNRNAIACLSSMINTLYTVKVPVDGDSKTTYNVGVISGGTSVNTIAQDAEMLYEYRSTSRKCLSEMENMLNKVIEAYRATGIEVEVERIGDRPCTGELDKDAHERLIEKARVSIKRVLGKDAYLSYSSTDANTPLSQGIPAICMGGAVGGRCHTREEWLDPESLLDGSRLLLDFMTNYFAAV